MTFPSVRVQGGPRERGRQYGEQARERVHRSVDAYREVFAHYAGWTWEQAVSEARQPDLARGRTAMRDAVPRARLLHVASHRGTRRDY